MSSPDSKPLSLLLVGSSVAVAAVAIGLSKVLFSKKGQRAFPVLEGGGIVISGASTGIGRHAAESLASSGRYLVFAGVRNEKDAAEIRALNNPNLVPITLDVASLQSIKAAAALVEAELKKRGMPLVAVVNNAGISYALPVELLDLAELRKVLEVNLVGPVAMTQAFLPQLRASRGRLINVGSVLGFTVAPLYGAYSASKFGLEAITDASRMELTPWDISVSLLEPGSIKTKIQGKVIGDNAAHHKLSSEQYSLYSRWFSKWDEAAAKHDEDSGDVSLTTDAMTHAITSPFPQTRYVLGSHQGVPLSISKMILPFLPDRLMDDIKTSNFKV